MSFSKQIAESLDPEFVPCVWGVGRPNRGTERHGETAARETMRAARRLSVLSGDCGSETLRNIAQKFPSMHPVAVFYVALVAVSPEMWKLCFPEATDVVVDALKGAARNLIKNVESSRRTVHAVLRCLARRDLDAQYLVTRERLLLPHYAKRAYDGLVLATCHFDETWARELLSEVRIPHVPNPSNEWIRDVRADVYTYCKALDEVFADDRVGTKYERKVCKRVWNGDLSKSKRAIALMCPWPGRVWREMGWCETPETRRRMSQVCDEGWSVSKREMMDLVVLKDFSLV